MSHNKTVYLSYRRDMCAFIALRVFRALVHAGFNVFMDTWKPTPQNVEFSLRQITTRAHVIFIDSKKRLNLDRASDDIQTELQEIARYTGRNFIELEAYKFENSPIHQQRDNQLRDNSELTSTNATFTACMDNLIEDMLAINQEPFITSMTEGEAHLARELMLETYQKGAPTAQQLQAETQLNLALNYLPYNQVQQHGLRKVFDIYPEYADAYYVYACTFRNIQDVAERVHVLLHFDRAIQLEPERAEYYFERAFITTDTLEKIADVMKAISLESDLLDLCYIYLAQIYEEEEKYRKAEQEYHNAIRIARRSHPSKYWRCAEFYERRGDYERAIDMLTWGIYHYPVNEAMYMIRGKLYRKMSRYEAAINDFTFIIENLILSNAVQEAHSECVNTYIEQERWEMAIAEYSIVMQKFPQSPTAYKKSAALKRQLGDDAGADEDIKEMFSAIPHLLNSIIQHSQWSLGKNKNHKYTMSECELVLIAYPDHEEANKLYAEAVEAMEKAEKDS